MIRFTVEEIGVLVEAIDAQLAHDGTSEDEAVHLHECRRVLLVELEGYCK